MLVVFLTQALDEFFDVAVVNDVTLCGLQECPVLLGLPESFTSPVRLFMMVASYAENLVFGTNFTSLCTELIEVLSGYTRHGGYLAHRESKSEAVFTAAMPQEL